MDKKDLLEIINAIIAKVQEKNNISEGEARAMVGMTLRVSSDAVVGACEVRKVSLS